MSLSPALEQAIELLDDKPTDWRTTLAELYFSGKLNEDDKAFLVVAGGSGDGGGGGGGTGDVEGPASSTDNAVVLFDGTTGKEIKDSSLTYSGGNLSAAVSMTTPQIKLGPLLSSDVVTINASGLTAPRTVDFPDVDGTMMIGAMVDNGDDSISLTINGVTLRVPKVSP